MADTSRTSGTRDVTRVKSPQRHLLWLAAQRTKFRWKRAFDRMRSPRRILATIIAVLFFVVYVLNFFFLLAARRTADTESLRLWLSGGMVLYLIYHSVRCVWTKKQPDMEFTEAEKLWIGGAPIHRSTFASYKLNSVSISAALKSLLITIALLPDTGGVVMLFTGVFSALVLLETVRVIWQRFLGGLSDKHRSFARVAITAIAIAAMIQFFAQLAWITPRGSSPGVYLLYSFSAIGNVACCDAIQWLAIPWRPAALLATTTSMTVQTAMQFAASVVVIPAALVALVKVDQWAGQSRLDRERERLRLGTYQHPTQREPSQRIVLQRDSLVERIESLCPETFRESVALLWRQAISIRRYSGTILFSFILPTLLCLSPLLTGRIGNQWSFVIGGIALCTMLLAPPALRLDFRRDMKRMLLLRSLPLPPIQTVVGQITFPVLITIAFQWTTLGIAALIVMPPWPQVVVWAGVLAALSLFTFAIENAIFLAFPHHENAQGFAMVVRANVMFLGKATIIVAAVVALMCWVSVCREFFSESLVMPAYVTGAIGGTWIVALVALLGTAWCWRRFDLAADLPPE